MLRAPLERTIAGDGRDFDSRRLPACLESPLDAFGEVRRQPQYKLLLRVGANDLHPAKPARPRLALLSRVPRATRPAGRAAPPFAPVVVRRHSANARGQPLLTLGGSLRSHGSCST